MAETTTPAPATPAPAPAAPAPTGSPSATPAPGPAAPAPQIQYEPGEPTDPVANREFWKKRHLEATGEMTKAQQEASRLRGDAPSTPAPSQTPNPSPLPDNVWTVEKQQAWELDQRIGRTPSLVPYNEEIKTAIKGGLSFEEAADVIAKRHNVVLGPSHDPSIELMPTSTGGGGTPSTGSGLSAEHEQSLRREGKDPESAKKHMGAVHDAWRKAKR